MSTAFDIAKAVVAELNTQFGSGFTAVLRAIPSRALDEIVGVCVSVVPRQMQPSQVSRATVAKDVTVDIGVQMRIGADFDGDVERAADQAQQILDTMWGLALSTAPGARFVEASMNPVFIPEHLEQMRLFTGIVRVTYRV